MNNVIKKKVKPYPILADLTIKEEKHNAKIVRIEPVGVLVQDGKLIYPTGTKGTLSFVFPTKIARIEEEVILVKTIDTLSKEDGSTIRLLEFHFRDLKPNNRELIVSFINAIGQR